MNVSKSDHEKNAIFFKYAPFIPAILTLFLELLQIIKVIDIGWLWILSPIWIWVGGCAQFLLGGILVGIMDKKGKK